MVREYLRVKTVVVAMVNVLKETLKKYYNILSKTGYRSYDAVDLLIILSFLQELTDSKYGVFLEYEDIRSIIELLGLINDKVCEYFSNEDINFEDYLDGHWYWLNHDLWLNQQLYMKDKTQCEKSEF